MELFFLGGVIEGERAQLLWSGEEGAELEVLWVKCWVLGSW